MATRKMESMESMESTTGEQYAQCYLCGVWYIVNTPHTCNPYNYRSNYYPTWDSVSNAIEQTKILQEILEALKRIENMLEDD